MPDQMTDDEFLQAAKGDVPTATTLLPLSQAELGKAQAQTPQPRSAVGPTMGELHEQNLVKMGKVPGVPFHEEGLDNWTTFWATMREGKDRQLRFLANKFGPENVRLNQENEPVVRIPNPKTGQPEDYPLNPRQMSAKDLTGLLKFAPEAIGAYLAVELGGPAAGVLGRSLLGAAGTEAGATVKDIATQAYDQPGGVEGKKSVIEHLERIPGDVLADLGLAGLVKGGQLVKGVASGKGLPNPLARTPLLAPADPALTREGVAAAERNVARSGIPSNLRPSEVSGIPLMAMLEQYFERKPAGASPMIAGKIRREDASKAFQNWLVDPSTLASDEAVGRKGLAAIKETVEPYEKEAALAQTAVEAEQKAGARIAQAQREGQVAKARTDILSGMNVAQLPTEGLKLPELGQVLREKFAADVGKFKAKASELYDKFFENPLAKEPIISGETLKSSVDQLRAELPKVTKEVEEKSGLFLPTGEKAPGQTVTKQIPISTPIRPRLDELSAKLEGGKVSINDLKQIRTDLDDAIKIGEAIPGVKEGRLKQTYKAVTDAINDGLRQIGDPELSQSWKDATTFYRENVDKFTEKNVARLAKEAEQTSSVGNAEFVKKAITSQDSYRALREFYGLRSQEMGALRNTVKNKVLLDSLGPGDMIDGQNLVRALKGLRDQNPDLYKDVFAGRGNQFLRAAEQLGTFQEKLPMAEVDKMLTQGAAGQVRGQKLRELERAQRRLGQEYQNEVVAKFIKGDSPLSELQPDKFVSFLPQAKLSDVQEIMGRLERTAPDVAEQVRRKSVQNLLNEARRSPQPRDTMAKLLGEPGDLISGTGISNALGHGDQLAKYKAILGGLYDPLVDYAKTELLGEERKRVAGGVGMLVPGSAMNAFVKALTPWEGGHKPEGILKELSGLARDKIVSILLSSQPLRNWLVKPYALEDASAAIKVAIISEPFIKGMAEEFKDAGELQKAMSILKVAFGTADRSQGEHQSQMTDEEFNRAASAGTEGQTQAQPGTATPAVPVERPGVPARPR